MKTDLLTSDLYPLPSTAMNPQDVIRHKRDGGELSAAEVEFFVRGVVTGEFADYQAAALLMAILWRGMTDAEQGALTQAMLR